MQLFHGGSGNQQVLGEGLGHEPIRSVHHREFYFAHRSDEDAPMIARLVVSAGCGAYPFLPPKPQAQ
jgi:hypothetical protein